MSKNKFNNIGLLYGALYTAAIGETAAANELIREYNLKDGYTYEDRAANITNEEAARAGGKGDLFGIILGQPGNMEKISEDMGVPAEVLLNVLQTNPAPILKYFSEKAGLPLDKMAEGGQLASIHREISVTINDKVYSLIVAVTEKEKEIGLMNVESMEDNEGMFFDYRNDPQMELSFWMKNTTIPLDIIFISEDEEVIKVIKGEPESEEMLVCKAKKSPIIAVIELNQNSGVKKGDDIEFEDFNESAFPELEPNKMYVIGSNGLPQAELQGEERIFSRIITRKMLKYAKKAFVSKLDKDYKKLGKLVFNELTAQDNRDPQYVNARNND